MHLQAEAQEELSKRAALKCLSLEAVQADMDAAALAEYGPALERLQRRLRRQQAAEFNKRMTSRAERFCRHVNEGIHHYGEAGEALKHYLDKKITAQKLAEIINAHLTPVPWSVIVTSINGHDNWSVDDGGAIDGWRELVLLAQERVALWRFRVCPICKVLFYDGSPRGDKTACSKQHKDQHNQRRFRAEQRSTEASA
jgi:hypothetical protein